MAGHVQAAALELPKPDDALAVIERVGLVAVVGFPAHLEHLLAGHRFVNGVRRLVTHWMALGGATRAGRSPTSLTSPGNTERINSRAAYGSSRYSPDA